MCPHVGTNNHLYKRHRSKLNDIIYVRKKQYLTNLKEINTANLCKTWKTVNDISNDTMH